MRTQALTSSSKISLLGSAGLHLSVLAVATLLLGHLPVARAQGTVIFNNRVTGCVVAHVYEACCTGGTVCGNGRYDYPPGTIVYSCCPPVSGSGYSAALLSAPGAWSTEFEFATPTTTFRTGGAAGFVVPVTATLANVAPDAVCATLKLFAWDNHGGRFTDPREAMYAWQSALIVAGMSPAFVLNAIGGVNNPSPNLSGLCSFSLFAGWFSGYEPPVILDQPRSQTVLAGQPATFNVSAIASPPLGAVAYQWRFQGSNVAGAYGSALSIPRVGPADAGDYSVLVFNVGGDTLSASARLTVLLPPPTLAQIGRLPGGGMRLDGIGTAGASYVLESTGSLAPPVVWSPVYTNLADAEGAFHLVDAQDTPAAQRFYRASGAGQIP